MSISSKRPVGPARAFTLVEMIVVVVLLGILVSVAMFSARSVLKNGWDTDARARLTQVAGAQQSLYRDFGRFSEAGADFTSLSGGTTVSHQPVSGPPAVSANVGQAGSVGLATRSVSGKCLYLRVAPLVGDASVKDVTEQVPSSAPCRGAEALPDDEGWVAPGPAGPTRVRTL